MSVLDFFLISFDIFSIMDYTFYLFLFLLVLFALTNLVDAFKI